MPMLPVLRAGDPLLKETAAPIKKVDAKLRKLLDDMADTMHQMDGVGLAAPQIGKSLRMVVIDIGDGVIELINPVILEQAGSCVDSEGCLSVPNVFGEVERAEEVTIEYLTRFNKKKKLTADGLLARCIQHEVDHLNGVLFIDLATSLREESPEDAQNG